ncbi:hypothetical protein ACS5PJ_15945 [Pseudarthrobacter sp. YS3]|jgi:hypothetical protein|uniref:hypothetical protein n=1 Tax=Pseudarthrobacter sp. YS3 TaxID=3453718 RepID=UPI003EECBA91
MDNTDLIESRSTIIRSNGDLISGDCVKAYYKGTLVYRGEVTEIAPNHELFWIMDVLTGRRRLVDIAELEIVRVEAPVHPADSQSFFTLPR